MKESNYTMSKAVIVLLTLALSACANMPDYTSGSSSGSDSCSGGGCQFKTTPVGFPVK